MDIVGGEALIASSVTHECGTIDIMKTANSWKLLVYSAHVWNVYVARIWQTFNKVQWRWRRIEQPLACMSHCFYFQAITWQGIWSARRNCSRSDIYKRQWASRNHSTWNASVGNWDKAERRLAKFKRDVILTGRRRQKKKQMSPETNTESVTDKAGITTGWGQETFGPRQEMTVKSLLLVCQ